MTDRSSDAAIEARLRGFLAAELRQAENDYPHLSLREPHASRGAGRLGVAVLVAGLVAAFALLRPWGGVLPTKPGDDPLGPDGLPLSIGGQVVLRGAAIDTRMETDDPGPFLAGGYLVLHRRACAAASAPPGGGCDEDWRLDDAPGANETHSVRLTTVSGGATFVRTSGAATVFRVKPVVDVIGGGIGSQNRQIALLIEAVAWRQPTKGRIPDNAVPALGGEVDVALVPDFVGAWGGPTGETIVGYVPKDLLLNPRSVVGGTPENPPQTVPVPVYGEDLTTLVGHMVPGSGFVPLGSSPLPSAPSGVGAPSAGP